MVSSTVHSFVTCTHSRLTCFGSKDKLRSVGRLGKRDSAMPLLPRRRYLYLQLNYITARLLHHGSVFSATQTHRDPSCAHVHSVPYGGSEGGGYFNKCQNPFAENKTHLTMFTQITAVARLWEVLNRNNGSYLTEKSEKSF